MSKSTSTPKKLKTAKGDVKETQKKEIFQIVKNIFSKYVPPLIIIKDTDTRFELISKRNVEFMGKKRDAMYFGAVMIHKGFTGLYLMHIYMNNETIGNLGAELKKALKGKSCFHLTKMDEKLKDQIDSAIKNGIDCYRKLKFI